MHSRYVRLIATCIVAAASATGFAAPKPPPTPPPPLTPPPPVPTAPNRPIDAAQREYDRTTGRVVDQPTYELNQIQSPPTSELEQIERDRDRQELIDRQQRAAAQQQQQGTAAVVPPLANPGATVVLNEDQQGLEADILEATVAYERATRQAQADLANDPQKLRARRRELGSQLEHRLDAILSRYAVRRIEASTQPAAR